MEGRDVRAEGRARSGARRRGGRWGHGGGGGGVARHARGGPVGPRRVSPAAGDAGKDSEEEVHRKSLTDCRHYLRGHCQHEDGCSFRHKDLVASSGIYCERWLETGSCTLDCPQMHPSTATITLTDCQKFLDPNSYCKKIRGHERSCQFRHNEAVRRNRPMPCDKWLYYSCRDVSCPRYHPLDRVLWMKQRAAAGGPARSADKPKHRAMAPAPAPAPAPAHHGHHAHHGHYHAPRVATAFPMHYPGPVVPTTPRVAAPAPVHPWDAPLGGSPPSSPDSVSKEMPLSHLSTPETSPAMLPAAGAVPPGDYSLDRLAAAHPPGYPLERHAFPAHAPAPAPALAAPPARAPLPLTAPVSSGLEPREHWRGINSTTLFSFTSDGVDRSGTWSAPLGMGDNVGAAASRAPKPPSIRMPRARDSGECTHAGPCGSACLVTTPSTPLVGDVVV